MRVEGWGFKAHRLVYHSTLGWRVIKKKKKVWGQPLDRPVDEEHVDHLVYRGTSLIRTPPPVGPYSSPMPRDLW